jgi:hypothetical protein
MNPGIIFIEEHDFVSLMQENRKQHGHYFQARLQFAAPGSAARGMHPGGYAVYRPAPDLAYDG